MSVAWGTIIWRQFGASIDTLDNALRACPDELWRAPVWDDPTDAPEFTEFWFIAYHTLRWLDFYLSGTPEDFAPPAPFLVGRLPDEPYTKAQLQHYLAQCRQKCQATMEALTDEKANQRCTLPWGEEIGFAELQLYNMRHVQEHAAQLSLLLGRTVDPAPDWVARAGGS